MMPWQVSLTAGDEGCAGWTVALHGAAAHRHCVAAGADQAVHHDIRGLGIRQSWRDLPLAWADLFVANGVATGEALELSEG